MGQAIRREFRCAYSTPVESAPDSILVVPLLANLLPVAWAFNATVTVKRVDRTFYEALGRLKARLAKFYPGISFEGRLRPDVIEDPDLQMNSTAHALFFSGGVDSTASLIRNLDRRPLLLTVRGADVGLDDDASWGALQKHLATVADREDLTPCTVRSNLCAFLDYSYINHRFRHSIFDWWVRVQHGPGLLSLAAPLTATRSIGRVHLAASLPSYRLKPWGSHPLLDELVQWSGSRCHHDGHELTRTAKLRLIVAASSAFPLFVCHQEELPGNCGSCAKCARTIVGLLAVGGDPRDYGFDVDRTTLSTIRNRLGGGHYRLYRLPVIWSELQQEAREHRPAVVPGPKGSGEFLDWFCELDINEVAARSARRYRLADRMDRLVQRYLPPSLSESLKDLYSRIVLR